MKQYLDACNQIIESGSWVENKRTGKKCLTKINIDFTYKPDEFPLLTTKKTFWKAAIAEMLGYIRGHTSAEDFRKLGTRTWDANANDNEAWLDNPNRQGEDDMGKAYRFARTGFYVESIIKHFEKPKVLKEIRVAIQLPVIRLEEDDDLIGKTFVSKMCGEFRVIAFKGSSLDKRTKNYNIQFKNTGYVVTVQKSQIKPQANIKDIYARTLAGVGYWGNVEDTLYSDLLYKTWSNMIERCYDTKHKHYLNYGAKGVFVHEDWHCFATFLKDVQSIRGWLHKKHYPKEYSLDKDWCHSNMYSKGTCKWASKKEQARNTSSVKTYLYTNEDGSNKLLKGLPHIQEYLGMSKGQAEKLTKTLPVVGDSTLTYIEIDQVEEIYLNLLERNDNRGLIMSAWNPWLEDFACLRPCMHSHNFSILNGKLYLNSTQRSADMPLGVPFNMVQVYFLWAVMAQITGLEMGEAYHKIVNAHFYEDQVEIYKNQQMNREPLPAPTFWINPEIKSLEDLRTWVTVDDFKVFGYGHHEAIKYPFSV